jgi:hypothetical protein
MSSAIDESIKEIAVKHGISIGRDDPILIFQTMNERLLEQHQVAQQELLSNFKEEIEQISSQWQDDAKNKAEKILNSALQASKSAFESQLDMTAKKNAALFKPELEIAIGEIRVLNREAKQVCRHTLYFYSALLCLCCVFSVIMYLL